MRQVHFDKPQLIETPADKATKAEKTERMLRQANAMKARQAAAANGQEFMAVQLKPQVIRLDSTALKALPLPAEEEGND